MSTLTTAPLTGQPSRADRHRNPTAFTTTLAKQAGLVEDTDYARGDPFHTGSDVFYTAKLLGDPILLTLRVINALGFRTSAGGRRWNYIDMPSFAWLALPLHVKVQTIRYMYGQEGGSALNPCFEAWLTCT